MYISGFLPGIFFGGEVYCYANFFCYANFSIVFGPNFGEGKSIRGGGDKLLQGGAPLSPSVEESQIFEKHSLQSLK